MKSERLEKIDFLAEFELRSSVIEGVGLKERGLEGCGGCGMEERVEGLWWFIGGEEGC